MVLSGRRVKDMLGHLESLKPSELLNLKSQLKSTGHRNSSALSAREWHLREAQSSFCDAAACTNIAYQHYSQIREPEETWDVQDCLHYAQVLARKGEFEKARAVLEKASDVAERQIDYLSMRAAINLCESSVSASNRVQLIKSAVNDYRKVFDISKDSITLDMLLDVDSMLNESRVADGTTNQRRTELESLIESSSGNDNAFNVKMRAALRMKLGHQWREVCEISSWRRICSSKRMIWYKPKVS